MSDLVIDYTLNQVGDLLNGNPRVLTNIESGSQISLYPLYGDYSYDNNQDYVVTFPVSPSELIDFYRQAIHSNLLRSPFRAVGSPFGSHIWTTYRFY
jgi:hypothetical protein